MSSTDPSSSSSDGNTASSSSPEAEEEGNSEKRLKTDKEDDHPPQSVSPPSDLSNGSTTTKVKGAASTPSDNGPLSKGAGGKSRKETTLPRGASKYSRGLPEATPSKVGSKLRLGAAASSIVKKTTDEIGSSFKPPALDPNARDAYKSLFHSTSKERPKEKTSNWVTFFPYH